MMKIYFLILLIALSLNAHSQDVLINGSAIERLLTWEDFSDKSDRQSPFFANTGWNLSFNSPKIKMDGDNILPESLQVTLSLDKKRTWVKSGKASDALLKHEQGHFDIGRLCQLDMLVALKSSILPRNKFNSIVQRLFEETFEKYKKLGARYDEETNHSINTEKQEEWNAFFASEKDRLLKMYQ